MKTSLLLMLPMLALAADPTALTRLFDAGLNPTQRAGACFELRGQSDAETLSALGRAMEDPELLSCAAENLRVVGAADMLARALGSQNAETRATAARVLGSLGKSEFLVPLSQAAQDENPLVASNALAGLSQYRDPAVVPYLVALARKGGMIGDMALDRVLELDPASALRVARGLVSSDQVPDQLYAMRALGAAGNSSDLPALQKIAAAGHENLAQRARGFGFLPPVNLSRAAESAIAAIKARGK